ncbi:hypothetical protein, partial [Nocardiopsis protaetiae]|uniref:hypothetical protein n=3 Tax=Nocardiopsis protaetiae TaxID=3382270 RepID=UPI00387A9F21
RPGPRGPGRVRAIAAAVAVALTAGLFADWDTLTGPLSGAFAGWGMPWPGRVTAPWPDAVALVAIAVAAVHPPPRGRGPLGVLAGAWSVPVTAFAAAGAVGALLGLLAGGSAGGAAQTVWHLLAQTGHGALFGLLFGGPAAIAVAAVALRTGERARPDGPRAPYAPLTAALLLLPAAAAAAGVHLLDAAPPADCSPLACASPRDELLLNGEVGLRLLLPGWAAAVLTIALLRTVPLTRRWPGWAHLILGTAATGAAVVLLSGLIVGSSV